MKPRTSWLRRGVAGIAIAAIAGGLAIVALAAFAFLRGGGDALVKVTPAGSAFYASIYLDPPGSQKLNLNNLLAKFPHLSSSSERDKFIKDDTKAQASLGHIRHVDVAAGASWARNQLSAEDKANYDSDVAPYLQHVTSAALTSTSGTDHGDMRLFVAIN